MALNIKNPEVEELVTKVAKITGRTKTETVRRAMREELNRHEPPPPKKDLNELRRWLEEEVWPVTAPNGPNPPMSKEEVEEILGFGPHGY